MPVLQKGLLWPQSPTCVRRYLQPAYSTELAERLVAPPTHKQWAREREKREEGKQKYENIIRGLGSSFSSCNPCANTTHSHEHKHTCIRTNTSGICLGERSSRDQPQSLALPHRLSSFCCTTEGKHHQLVGLGGFLITSESFGWASHKYCAIGA